MEARLTLQAYRALEERSAQVGVFDPLSGRCQTTEQDLERDIARHCLITMESGRADPASIRPGKTTRITLVYTVLTAGSATLTLGRGMTYAGKNVATFDSEVLTMADGGTHEVTFPVNIPARAPGGHYEVMLRLSRSEPVCDGRAVTLGVPFRVK
jgi:hypothetical protein